MSSGAQVPAQLPPLLVVAPAPASTVDALRQTGRAQIDGYVMCLDSVDNAELVAGFGVALVAARRRGDAEGSLWLGDDKLERGPGDVVVPHVFLWAPSGDVALVWERLKAERAAALMGTNEDRVRRWSERPDLVRRLAALAQAGAPPNGDGQASNSHLSFRWIVNHEAAAAAALSAARVHFDHVSVHVSPAEEQFVVDVLCGVVGLVGISRPPGITTPGRWLQCGSVRLHLNSREPNVGESGFPGTAPNHVCLRIGSVADIECALHARGVETVRSGSLRHQLWWRLASGTVIEFQQVDSVTESEVFVEL